MILDIEYLEEAREESLLTITQAAALAEISASTYRKILNGERVTGRTVRKLIKKLKLDKEKLIRSTE